jgi:DNA repair ATPase RecN
MQKCSTPNGTFQMQSAPLDYVATPSGYQCMNPSIAQPVILRDPQFNNLSVKLDQVCCKLNKLDEIDARLKNYEESLGRVTRDVTDLKNNYGHIMDNVKSISDMFDDVTTNMKRELQVVSRQMSNSAKAVDEIEEIKSELRDVKESHIELQWRTMRDNLIFTGIAEVQMAVVLLQKT